MAEGFARDIVAKHVGPSKYQVHSAGIESRGVNPWAVRVMQEVGIDILTQTSERIDARSIKEFDVVIRIQVLPR
jgi:arsenate reductase|tara:strand:+ start:1375 stop:1596 length:222 start_codon:yes stop_codon:yes gene_type:complete